MPKDSSRSKSAISSISSPRKKLIFEPPSHLTDFATSKFKMQFIETVASIAPDYGWDEIECLMLSRTLYNCLVLKSVSADPMEMSLPAKVDMCWHALILETELYRTFCQYLGTFVNHSTKTAKDNKLFKNMQNSCPA
jgi:hypothetical protein